MLRTIHRLLQTKKLPAVTDGIRFISVSHKRTTEESTDSGGPLPEKSLSDVDTEKKPPVPPPAPPLELCCMSGCQNCVMIQHAEELLKLYNDDRAARAAIEEIPDENLKAFLKIELNLK